MRTIGSKEVARWLEAGKLTTIGSRINLDHLSCFAQAVGSFRHFGDPSDEESSTVE
jgi:hypothetical protein